MTGGPVYAAAVAEEEAVEEFGVEVVVDVEEGLRVEVEEFVDVGGGFDVEDTELVLLLTDEVDVLVTTLTGADEVDKTLVVDSTVEAAGLEDVVAAVGMRLYNSSLFPAPQYSRLLPGQRKLQSVCKVALTLPALRVLPQ